MRSLDVHWSRYDTKFPSFTEPKQIGGFSLDEDRTFHNDERRLRFVALPKNLDRKVKFDLNLGYETAVIKSHGLGEKIDALLKWIMNNKTTLKRYIVEKGVIADFVSFRGTLSLLLCTPYERREGWTICAKKMNGTIYLCQFDTPEKIKQREAMDERGKRMSYWGYKFEQYVTAAEPEGVPDTSEVVNELEEYCCMARAHLGPFSLIFGAETDGVDHKVREQFRTKAFYEMKTNRHLETANQERSFVRNKLLKWWSQSFLIGIRKILCGFRDDDGFVTRLKIYNVAELPAMAKNEWKANVCMNFAVAFLEHVVKCFERDDSILLRFNRNPGDSHVTCTAVTDDDDYEFLPDWFSYSTSIKQKQEK